MNNILVDGARSAMQDIRETVRKCTSRALIRRILVLASVNAVMYVMLTSPAQAEPQQLTFPVNVAAHAGERRALVCAPKGPPPFAAVVFNHGSIVDMMGWPGATQRGYRLDRVCEALAAEGYFVFAPIRENTARGLGFPDYEDAYREIVLQAIDHVKALPEVDVSRWPDFRWAGWCPSKWRLNAATCARWHCSLQHSGEVCLGRRRKVQTG